MEPLLSLFDVPLRASLLPPHPNRREITRRPPTCERQEEQPRSSSSLSLWRDLQDSPGMNNVALSLIVVWLLQHAKLFKILTELIDLMKVADMHYGNGGLTRCRDVLDSEFAHCSDHNTSLFLKRMIQAEKPDFIAFTGSFWFSCF